MRGRGAGALLGLILLLGPEAAQPVHATHEIDVETLRRSLDRYYQEKALEAIGRELKEGILHGEPGAVAQYVKAPLLCRRNTIPQQKVLADLKNPRSELYIYLFDPEGYRKKYPGRPDRPMALKEYFERAKDLRVVASAPELVTGGVSFQSAISPVNPYFEFVYHGPSGWAFGGLGFPGCED